MTAVSILVPLYNCEKTVHRAFKSLQDQTFQDFEVIAVNNNCTDSTVDIVKEFQSTMEIKVIDCPEQGIVPALNVGIRNCASDLIARQDGDDYWHPDKLEKQIAFLQNNPGIDILGTQIRLLDEDGTVQETGTMGIKIRYPIESHQIIAGLLYGQNTICHPSVIVRKRIFDYVGGYEQLFPLAEDLHLWTRCIPHFKFANLPEVLVDYTQKYDPTYNAQVPLLISDMYYELYKIAGVISGEREQRVYDWQVDPNSHGNVKG